MNINKSIKEFKTAIPGMNKKYRPYAEQVINLFRERKIEKRREAEKLLEQLSSRGKGPQSAIRKITDKKKQSRERNRQAQPTNDPNIFF